MDKIIEESKKYQRYSYGAGMLRAYKIVLTRIEKELTESHKRKTKPNSVEQIFNDGYIKAYQHIKDIVNAKIKNHTTNE